MAEAKTKEKKDGTVTRAEFDDLAAFVRKLDGKVERHSENFVRAATKYFERKPGVKAGLVSALIMCLLCGSAFAKEHHAYKDYDSSRTKVYQFNVDGDGSCSVVVTGTVAASEGFTGPMTPTTLTASGKLTANGELEANDLVDVNLGAADEFITIDQTSAVGTASTPLIGVTDARTGATANTAAEATLVITASGTHGLYVAGGISDLSGGDVEILDDIDTAAGSAMTVGKANATSLTLGASDIITAVAGDLTVLDDIDTAAGSAMTIGKANATSLTLGASDIITDVAGDLTILDDIDTAAGSAMTVGKANATSLTLGASDITTAVAGALTILNGADTATGTTMTIGAANATALDLGASDIITDVLGDLVVLDDIDTAAGSAMTVGKANATSLTLGASDIVTDVAGDLTILDDIDTAAGSAMTVGKANATSLALGASDITTTIPGNGTITLQTTLSAGLKKSFVTSATNMTLSAANYVVSYDTSGGDRTCTLPEASTMYSGDEATEYKIVLDTAGNDLFIDTDGTDTFDGTNTRATLDTAAESISLMATADNRWSVLNWVGVGFTTQ